jgi:membrane protein involved in colicin uptake
VAPALVAAAKAVAGSDNKTITAGALAQCLGVDVALAVLLVDSVAALTPPWLQVRACERERGAETERETENREQRERQRQRDRDREIDRERQRDRDRETDRERERKTEKERDRARNEQARRINSTTVQIHLQDTQHYARVLYPSFAYIHMVHTLSCSDTVRLTLPIHPKQGSRENALPVTLLPHS